MSRTGHDRMPLLVGEAVTFEPLILVREDGTQKFGPPMHGRVRLGYSDPHTHAGMFEVETLRHGSALSPWDRVTKGVPEGVCVPDPLIPYRAQFLKD